MVVRIWDCFWLRGLSFFYLVALSIFKITQEITLQYDMEEFMIFLKFKDSQKPLDFDCEQLLTCSIGYFNKIKPYQIREIENEAKELIRKKNAPPPQPQHVPATATNSSSNDSTPRSTSSLTNNPPVQNTPPPPPPPLPNLFINNDPKESFEKKKKKKKKSRSTAMDERTTELRKDSDSKSKFQTNIEAIKLTSGSLDNSESNDSIELQVSTARTHKEKRSKNPRRLSDPDLAVTQNIGAGTTPNAFLSAPEAGDDKSDSSMDSQPLSRDRKKKERRKKRSMASTPQLTPNLDTSE